MWKGYQTAIIGQVPYTLLTFGIFEFLSSNTMDKKFTKHDEYPFIIKYLVRFGAGTAALLAA